MKKISVLFLLVAMLVSPAVSFAASPWTEGDTYGEKTVGKLQFAVTNVLFGWVDVFAEPIRTYDGCNNCKNVWMGMGKGLVDGFVNEVGGLLHLITFPVPVDIPLPDNGVQLTTDCNPGGNA